ncbi:MAG TPA: hypothetical protein EYQ50_22360 [Verrucomicrobiales bacterium]|nr:hypothetical protein [Verrucomicrobiales bacterium]
MSHKKDELKDLSGIAFFRMLCICTFISFAALGGVLVSYEQKSGWSFGLNTVLVAAISGTAGVAILFYTRKLANKKEQESKSLEEK